MTNRSDSARRPSLLLAYGRLFRLPNVFTAVADVTMGFLFVRHERSSVLGVLACLVCASSLLYLAGMVLNDVYDIERDRQERPFRPLPSGQIGLAWARWLGYEMLLVGIALAAAAGFLYPGAVDPAWRVGAVACALAATIVLYDAGLKRTAFGPLAMGACRFLNVLMGMSVGGAAGPAGLLGYDGSQVVVAAGIGLYIVGVTWFARSEAAPSGRGPLLVGVAWMIAGFVLLGYFSAVGRGASRLELRPAFLWPCLLLLIGFTIVRRCVVAVLDPRPGRVQGAVEQCILSLIVLDASVCLAVAPAQPYWAIGVLALLAPTLVLGKWVYST